MAQLALGAIAQLGQDAHESLRNFQDTITMGRR
jgi:hypothetical protein